MADYFIELELASNGDGTAATPWNQFTSAEHTTVSGGDFLWFRRYHAAVNTDIIEWLAGDSAVSKIHYVAWPSLGKPYFDQRPTDKRADWDDEPDEWLQQHTNSTSVPTVTLPSYVYVQGFHIKNTYGSYSGQKALLMNTVFETELCECLIDTSCASSAASATIWMNGTIYLQSCVNVNFQDSVIRCVGSYSYERPTLLNAHSCEGLTFSGCDLDIGFSGTQTMIYTAMIEEDGCWLYNSDVHFYGCTFHMSQPAANCSQTGFYTAAPFYSEDSDVLIDQCDFLLENDLSTSTLKNYPDYSPCFVFQLENGTFTVQNSLVASTVKRYSFLTTKGTCVVDINNVEWTTTKPECIFLANRGATSIELTNISGSVYSGTGVLNDECYLMAFASGSYLDNITFNNVPDDLGYILDVVNDNQVYDIPSTFKQNRLMLGGCVSSITKQDSACYGINLYYKDYDTTDYIYGGDGGKNKQVISLSDCNTINSILTLDTTYVGSLELTVYNCSGDGSEMFNHNGLTSYDLLFKATRNNSYASLGSVYNSDQVKVYSSLNDFDSGVTSFRTKAVNYKTSSVYRTDGAGYSIYLQKTEDNTDYVTYPNICEDAVWVHIPAANTYTITAYVSYACSSYTLTTDDIQLGIDVMGGHSNLYRDSTLATDASSAWTTLSGINITLTHTLTFPSEQYCPIRLYLKKYVSDLHVYLDPKLTVTLA